MKWLVIARYDSTGEMIDFLDSREDSYLDVRHELDEDPTGDGVLADLGSGEYMIVPTEGASVYRVDVEPVPPIVTVSSVPLSSGAVA